MTTTAGSPDESRSARIIIKDLVNAKLLLCTPPPGEPLRSKMPRRAPRAARRTPRAPTEAPLLDKVQADYDQQKHTTVHMGGRKTTHESNKHHAVAPRCRLSARRPAWSRAPRVQ